jgi:hypothetical protein
LLGIVSVIQLQRQSLAFFGELEPCARSPAPAVVEVGHVCMLDLAYRVIEGQVPRLEAVVRIPDYFA